MLHYKIRPVLFGLVIVFMYSAASALPAEYPKLVYKTFNVNIPKYIFGVQKDSAVTYNDTLHYVLKGQRYGKNEGVLPVLDKPDGNNTPYEVLATAMYYYHKKDVEQVKNLFDKANHNALSELMPGKKLDSFVDAMSAVNEAKIEMAFEYKTGVLCLVNFKGMNTLPVYLTKIKGKYYLSPLNDDKPTVYNLMVLMMTNPQPFEPATIVSMPDTLKQDTLSNMVFRIKTAGNYLVIGENKPGTPVFLLCKDNTAPDIDNTGGVIKFTAQSHNFPDPGKMNFIAFESNYPVNQIFPEMIRKGKAFSVYIKK